MSMFCYQCQEAAQGTGCENKGVCGKPADVANMQDLLTFVVKGIAYYANQLNDDQIKEAADFVTRSLFKTITNANFNKFSFIDDVKQGLEIRDGLRSLGPKMDNLPDCATWTADTPSEFETKATSVGILSVENEDIRSLKELIIYGLKGIAAYLEHANALKYNDIEINRFIIKALVETTDPNVGMEKLIATAVDCGKFGVDVMALLDKANTESYGHPEITEVNLGVRNKPAILISGHDLKDMELLLAQTDGTGVDVYTHSEMLPAHYYPAFKKYSHFVGNYGSAWWNQYEEFEKFNGPVLLTTNCLKPPKDSYKDRIYTTGAAGYEGCSHVSGSVGGAPKDFSTIIEHAKKCASPTELETGKIVGGFAHNQVLALADKVIDAVKTGAIKKFVVMAGCDGQQQGRSYYSDFAEQLPDDTVILTAGCAKYRYNKLDLGDIGGIPRVLDAGQCNDSYSLAVIALKLKEVFELEDINDLPIIYNIAWYEQKAVIVLLALLYLGVKNIKLGPTLPAFLSPTVVNFLVETFGISGTSEVDSDMTAMMA
jgi:hydroxylamine reductase